MTQMPQMVALFNGVGGGAASLVALVELQQVVDAGGHDSWFNLAATAFTIAVGAISFAGLGRHLRQAAGPDDVAAGGLPRAADRVRRGADRLGRALGDDGRRPADVGRHRARPARPAGRRPAGAAGRRRRRADRDLAAQRVHRPDRGRRRLRALQRAAPGGRHAGRLVRHVPDPADGAGHGPLGAQHPLRGAQGRLDPRRRRGQRPAGQERHPRGRRDHAGVRRPRDHRARLRPGGGPGPAHPARARRRARRARTSRSTTPSTRSPAGCPAT